MSMTDVENIDEISPWVSYTFNPRDWMPMLPSHFPFERPPARLGHHNRLTSLSHDGRVSENRQSRESLPNENLPDPIIIDLDELIPARIFEVPTEDESSNILNDVLQLQNQQDDLMDQIELLERAHEQLDAARNELLQALLRIENEHDEELPRYDDVVVVDGNNGQESDSESQSSISEEEGNERETQFGLGIRSMYLHNLTQSTESCRNALLDSNGDIILHEKFKYIPDRYPSHHVHIPPNMMVHGSIEILCYSDDIPRLSFFQHPSTWYLLLSCIKTALV
jgi:hypothetical protein